MRGPDRQLPRPAAGAAPRPDFTGRNRDLTERHRYSLCSWSVIIRAKTRLVCWLVAASAACALTGCAVGSDGEPQADGPVKIGLLAPITGPNAAEGRAAVQGATLATEIVNGANPSVPLPLGPGTGLPGLGGATVRLVSADSRSEPAFGGQQAADLAAGRVAGIVGAYDVDVTQAASQRTERTGVPWINGDSSARFLTDLGMDWFFRIGPSDRTYGEAFFSMLRQEQARGVSVSRIAVLRTDDETSSDIVTGIVQLANQGGVAVAVDLPLEPGQTRLSSGAVRELRQAKPDAVVLISSSAPDAASLTAALDGSGFSPPVLMALGRGFDGSFLTKRTGDDIWLRPRAWSPEVAARNPAAKAVADLYQQKYKAPMTETAASSFTAVLALAQAIQNARSTEPAKVRAALLALNIPGTELIMPWNGIQFDDNRQNKLAAGVIERIVGGRAQVVFPIELARAPAGAGQG